MSEEVYRRLATRLDDIPNGFPAAERGVDLDLLARMFTPEEAPSQPSCVCGPRRLWPSRIERGLTWASPLRALRRTSTRVESGAVSMSLRSVPH